MSYKTADQPQAARRDTRAALLHAAVPLFRDRGLEHVSVAEIARDADAYPNQVTYHFHSKESLFVHAACHAILRTAHQAEQLAQTSTTPTDHARDLVTYLLGTGAPEVMMFAEAMLTARRTPELQQLITDTTTELYTAGEAAMVHTFARTGWDIRATPGDITRGFWAAILGLALEKAALGEQFDDATADAVVLMLVRLNATRSEGNPS
jgi:AcrR family transcriptional regulator